jgi:hypothetical protein
VALAAVLGVAAPAAHAAEDESALSLSFGYGRFRLGEASPDGVVLGFEYERGISDALALRVAAGGGTYVGDALAYSGHTVLGLTYLFDVIKYVPYLSLGIGAIAVGGDNLTADVFPLVELGLGLDVLASRTFSYGVLVRFETYAEKTSFLTAGARLTWRWGFF